MGKPAKDLNAFDLKLLKALISFKVIKDYKAELSDSEKENLCIKFNKAEGVTNIGAEYIKEKLIDGEEIPHNTTLSTLNQLCEILKKAYKWRLFVFDIGKFRPAGIPNNIPYGKLVKNEQDKIYQAIEKVFQEYKTFEEFEKEVINKEQPQNFTQPEKAINESEITEENAESEVKIVRTQKKIPWKQIKQFFLWAIPILVTLFVGSKNIYIGNKTIFNIVFGNYNSDKIKDQQGSKQRKDIPEKGDSLNDNLDLESNKISMKWWNGLSLDWQKYFIKNANLQIPVNETQILKIQDIGGVDLHGYKIYDLKPLEALSWIYYVNCSGTEVTNLESLKSLKGLQKVICDSVNVSDLSPLYDLPNLTFIRAINTKIPEPMIATFRMQHPKIKVIDKAALANEI